MKREREQERGESWSAKLLIKIEGKHFQEDASKASRYWSIRILKICWLQNTGLIQIHISCYDMSTHWLSSALTDTTCSRQTHLSSCRVGFVAAKKLMYLTSEGFIQHVEHQGVGCSSQCSQKQQGALYLEETEMFMLSAMVSNFSSRSKQTEFPVCRL